MLIVSGSYQKLSEWSCEYSADRRWKGGGRCLGMTVNLLMCVRGDALYSVHATV
jgi:hypothetical protein